MNLEKELLKKSLGNSTSKTVNYSGLNLAYIGDAVFEILVRTYVVTSYNSTVNQMDKLSRSYVKASAQAKVYHKLMEICTEDEIAILKRGRNAKSYTSAKNASTTDYRHATGVEALFGYLYLEGKIDRLHTLFENTMEVHNGKKL